MILASSSGDHFDCFFAGDWVEKSCVVASLLAGTAERAAGSTGATLVAILEEMESDGVSDAEELVESASSSSSGLSNDEISTLGGGR
jgi:hypothetical protein